MKSFCHHADLQSGQFLYVKSYKEWKNKGGDCSKGCAKYDKLQQSMTTRITAYD
jgi:hypothetical protein